MTALRAWRGSLMADMTSASDFDIREMRRKPISVFIAAPVSDFATAEPIVRLFIQQVHDILLRARPGRDEPHKVLFILDEFYQFKRFPEIVERAPLVAGFGFRIALVAQNIPQIDEKYSKATREALLGNMDIKLFVAVGDKATGDVVSDAMGKRYVEKTGWSDSHSAGPFATRSRQGSWLELPLMTSDELQRMDDRKTALNVRGNFSAMLTKLNFYTDKRFVRRIDEVWRFSPLLAAPAVERLPEWDLFIGPTDELKQSLTAAGRFGPAWATARSAAPDARAWGAARGQAMAAKILPLAKTAFEDWRKFMVTVERAMIAPDQSFAEEIVRHLRRTPEACGALRGLEHGWSIKRRNALSAVRALARLVAIAWNDVEKRRAAVDEVRSRKEGSTAPRELDAEPADPNVGANNMARPSSPDPAATPPPKAEDEQTVTVPQPEIVTSFEESVASDEVIQELALRTRPALVRSNAAETFEAGLAAFVGATRVLTAAVAEDA